MLQLFNCIAPPIAITKKPIEKEMQYRAYTIILNVCVLLNVWGNIVGVYKYLYHAF